MTVAHPIPTAWLTAGATGAQNYDEFADDAEITEIIEANPSSALAIEMPHRAPGSLGKSFAESLPDAVVRLTQAKDAGAYRRSDDVVVLYRISDHGATAYGLWCMVDTDQISTSADEPGLVIRNEDVFLEKVRERVALFQALGHLLSPVLLLQTGRGEELHAALAEAAAQAGAPAATDVDPAGRTHAIWPLAAGPVADRLRELAGTGELVVADGNHRSLAAQSGGLDRFLAVVTTPASVAIQPYNRLVHQLDAPIEELLERLEKAGAQVSPGTATVPAQGGTVHLYADGRAFAVTLPRDPHGSVIDNIDHALVERVLFADALGLEPGDKRITYVGGDYPASWLAEEVDAGRSALAVLIAPVTVDDFVEVNLARQKMPRKSTWFTPKARGGLVVAQVA
ncbi:hypothetical protein Cs7R123_28210 [Catellatospora sp. TT07R-123]|uniref:DUF1015 family protein n=1 Tax=Catellatospora sp. TT07R-123 TaxID=2733863 RepID=UPI001B2241FC|nr:DUF1015 family protein [Catellatospora sp. TT07R-123]GHJ45479.1 hypothetical protein Cs7R123_28210 [Catellatospora sp. TT07R-123]